MLILGHVGLTVSAALAGEAALVRSRGKHVPVHPVKALRATALSLSRRIDLRVLLVASLLPDIIDKPLGLVLYSHMLGAGRLFAHTIWFPTALLVAGILFRTTKAGSALLVLAFGSAMHLVLDSMWRTPATLLWPLLGPFPRGEGRGQWFASLVHSLLNEPGSYVPEIAGAILLLALLFFVARRTSLLQFLRTGQLNA